MNFEIGQIIFMDDEYGKIFCKENLYTFLNKDICDQEKLTIGDYVIFRKEVINGFAKAFFIKNANHLMKNNFTDIDSLTKGVELL